MYTHTQKVDLTAVRGVPHPFPYQGDKRQLAKKIFACLPPETKRLVEPFAGSAAVTLATAHLRRARYFVLNDAHDPLMKLRKQIVQQPHELSDDYKTPTNGLVAEVQVAAP